jgi:PKD domain-containing protein
MSRQTPTFRERSVRGTLRANRRPSMLLIIGTVGLFVTAAPAADIVTVPTSLAPGDQYRLAFVTSTTRDATSSDISVYNQFVDDLAESVPELAALNQDWKAIASASGIDALTNTGTDPSPAGDTGVPIFLLNDTQLVDHYDDLWDDSLDTPLNVTETGASGSGTDWVWSGTSPAGTAYFRLGSDSPTMGDRLVSGSHWIQAGRAGDAFSYHLYAMSEVMTIPEPEPITVPTSLAPGDQYRLAFVTSTTRNATSSDISVYNEFVDDLAESVPELAALNQDWKAIASASGIDALTNTGTDPSPAGDTGVPIFLLNDTKLVDHYDDLWDGSLDTPLDVTETGAPGIAPHWVWSGTSPAGTAYFRLGLQVSTMGDRLVSGNHWIQAGRAGDAFSYHLYAMSGVMTIPAPQAPVADADGPYTGAIGVPVQFDGLGSTDSDGTIVSDIWDFGDGGTGTGVAPAHTYDLPGLYTVTLTVTDNDGLTDTDTSTADIQGLDLDITGFRVSKSARLGAKNPRPITVKLTVQNGGTAEGPAIATVIGVQNGIEVYDEMLMVSDAPGKGRSTFEFPGYLPEATGDISWTAGIADDDPDQDLATATTSVRSRAQR